MRIFFSYPHDANAELVEVVRAELESHGHEVWMDGSQIKAGDDWRAAITRGILDSDRVVAFLSRHGTRDPGVCLNEIAIALAEKGEHLVSVLVEPEAEVRAPVSITHMQFLRMEDWPGQHAQGGEAWTGWYGKKVEELLAVLENPREATREADLQRLREKLRPLSQQADIVRQIPTFTGREWVFERYGRWLAGDERSRVFRIEGGPGLGKSAIAAKLAHSAKNTVIGVHLCRYNQGTSRDPRRMVQSLAYQLATRLPDYRARLLRSPALEELGKLDAGSLFSELLVAPLHGQMERQRLAIVIDGLDEASEGGRNPIVELLTAEIEKLPRWIGVVLTGRPDPELNQRLRRYEPEMLSGESEHNRADLRAYLDGWLATEPLAEAERNHVAGELLVRSEGVFLYVTEVRAEVQAGRIDLRSPDRFPQGLSGIYLNFFERRFPDQERYKKEIRPLLELILASPEPLPLELARDMLSWDEYAEAEILEQLGSLFPLHSNAFVPFHASVRDWLQDKALAGRCFVLASQGQVPLADTLLRLIETKIYNGQERNLRDYALHSFANLTTVVPMDTVVSFPGRSVWDLASVLDYVARCLEPDHAEPVYVVSCHAATKNVAANPSEPTAYLKLARYRRQHAMNLVVLDRKAQALDEMLAAIEAARQAHALDSRSLEIMLFCLRGHLGAARLMAEDGLAEKARAHIDDAQTYLGKMVSRSQRYHFGSQVFEVELAAGDICLALCQWTEAAAHYLRALEEKGRDAPEGRRAYGLLSQETAEGDTELVMDGEAIALSGLASVFAALGQTDEAVRALGKAYVLYRSRFASFGAGSTRDAKLVVQAVRTAIEACRLQRGLGQMTGAEHMAYCALRDAKVYLPPESNWATGVAALAESYLECAAVELMRGDSKSPARRAASLYFAECAIAACRRLDAHARRSPKYGGTLEKALAAREAPGGVDRTVLAGDSMLIALDSIAPPFSNWYLFEDGWSQDWRGGPLDAHYMQDRGPGFLELWTHAPGSGAWLLLWTSPLASEACRAGLHALHPGVVPLAARAAAAPRPPGTIRDAPEKAVAEMASGERFDSLKSILDSGARLPREQALRITLNLLGVLAHIHASGVVHRNLHPGCVFVDVADRVVLTGLDLAAGTGFVPSSAKGEMPVTIVSMSPEQALERECDARSDIFQVGIMLYQLLTGVDPFAAPNVCDRLKRILSENPPPPSSIDDAVPFWLDTVALCALAKEPDLRYASVAEFSAAIIKSAPDD